MKIKPNQEFIVPYPFVKSTYVSRDSDGAYEEECWEPGCKNVPLHPDDFELVAEGLGEMILTVVDVHKPGKYPERVFYTRKWIDPDGKQFGKNKLHITTTPAFKRRASGYFHGFRVVDYIEQSDLVGI